MANTKTFLLFQPKNIFTQKAIIAVKQLIKTPDGFATGDVPLQRPQLKTWFKTFNDDTINAIADLAPAQLQKVTNGMYAQTIHISDNAEREKITNQAFFKHIYATIGALRRLSIQDWYHPVEITNKRFQNFKCSFYPYPVEIIFSANRIDDSYSINPLVEIGKEKIPIRSFQQYHFLVEKDDQYYQISPRSYDALKWLQSQKKAKTSIQHLDILERLLTKLSSYQATIERSGLEAPETISVVPETKILLSELNNTFLKLEPQFIYDGFIVDGPFEPVSKVKAAQKTVLINRNKEKEEELVGYLRSLHEKFANQNNGFFYLPFAEAQKKGWFIKTYYLLLDKDIDLLGIDLLKHFRYSPHKAETLISKQTTDGDWALLNFSLKFGKEKVPLLTLQKALLNNQKAVMLKDGSLGVLGEDWIAKYGLIVRHGKIKKDELQVAKWLQLSEFTGDQQDDTEIKTGVTADWLSKWKKWEQKESGLYPLPVGLQVKQLRPYQIAGYEWLRLLSDIGAGGCLADDMGLGKTLQTISFLLHRIEENPQGKHLVVAPASLLYNWLKELEKFTKDVKANVLHGNNRDTAALAESDCQVFITSYGTLRQDIHLIENIVWETIVLDESHHIKNPAALTTKAVWQLTAKTKIALSGTPIMNSTSDMHSQMHFLIPGLLGSAEFFKKEYAIPIEQQANEEKAASLQKLIRPFLLRRTKEQVAKDLPDKTESVLWCEMGADQRAAYETIKDNIRSNIYTEISENGLNKGKLNILAGLTKLRQLCNSCELVKDEDLFTYDSVKTKVLISEIKGIIPHHRALVFSQFTSMLDLLERDLKEASIPTLRLDGQTQIKKRQELVNEFQSEDSEAQVFLISLKAGNTGLTLTQADYVFLFDPWWNTAVESQAIDRTHRIGQTKQVFAYRMICRDSIEERIIQLSGKKKKFSEELITTEESLIKSLTFEDIQFLLN